MLKNRATAEGTLAYARRYAGLPGNFRPMLGGLSVSSVGIGTYLGETDDETDQAYAQSIRTALLGGINLIDTAVNYRFQRSERTIGKVLGELVAAGELRREEVVVATKGGYITFDGTMPPNPRAWFEEKYVSSGMVEPGELVEGSHCMTPRYLGAMLEMSRANLGLDTIDIYYIHNPETQLATIARPEFLERMRRAFEFLEQQVAGGKIGVYGTATWSGFRLGPEEPQYLQMEELVKIAFEIAGRDHHFRASSATVQPGDARGADARQPAASRPARHRASRRGRFRHRSMRQRLAAPGAAGERLAADHGAGLRRADQRRAACAAIRALGARDQRGASGHEVGGARERGSAGVAASPGIDRSLLQALHPQQERVNIRSRLRPDMFLPRGRLFETRCGRMGEVSCFVQSGWML